MSKYNLFKKRNRAMVKSALIRSRVYAGHDLIATITTAGTDINCGFYKRPKNRY